jgi:hypothetical protein
MSRPYVFKHAASLKNCALTVSQDYQKRLNIEGAYKSHELAYRI